MIPEILRQNSNQNNQNNRYQLDRQLNDKEHKSLYNQIFLRQIMPQIINMLFLYWTAFLTSMAGVRANTCNCDVSHMTQTSFTVYVNSGSPGNYTGQYNPAPWLSQYGLMLTQYIDFGVPKCSNYVHDSTKCRASGNVNAACCTVKDSVYGVVVATCADGYYRSWGYQCYTLPDGSPCHKFWCTSKNIENKALEWVGDTRIGNLELADDIVLVKAQSPNLNLVNNNPDGYDETFRIKGTNKDGSVCTSPDITIHYSCANANFKITHGNPNLVSVKLEADISTPFATIEAGVTNNEVAVKNTLLWIVTSGCFQSYELLNPSDAALQIDATTGVITWSVTPTLGQSYTTQVKMNVPDRDPYTSPVITMVAACLTSNVLQVPTTAFNTTQIVTIGDVETDFQIPKFSAPLEDQCAITYAMVSPSLPGGYSSFVVSAVTSTASFGFTDKSTPQVLTFTLSVSASGDANAAWTQASSYTLQCGSNSVTSAVDTSVESLLFEAGTAPDFYFEFAEFVLTPVNGCKVTSYTVSIPNDLASPEGPDANGKYKIKVIDSIKGAVYKFTITAVVEGGFSYTTAEKTITVLECGPTVPTITDTNSNNHTLRIGELDSTYWKLPAATHTPTRCPIEKVVVCSKSEGSPDCSKLPTGLGYTSTSEHATSIFLESTHWNVTGDYTFYLQYTMKGGSVHYTLEKVISVICPATVKIERDLAQQERDFYILGKSETTRYFYNWESFRTEFRFACPVLSYGVFQMDSEGNEIFPVEFDSQFGVQEEDQKGWYRVSIQNKYLKDLRQIDFNFTATIKGGNVYKSLKTIQILERPVFNFPSNLGIQIVEQVEEEVEVEEEEVEAEPEAKADGNVTANEQPRFQEETLEKVLVEKGQPFEYTSPVAYDPEEDDFNITMTESSEEVDAVFTSNDNKSFSLSFETDSLDPGLYQFEISLNEIKPVIEEKVVENLTESHQNRSQEDQLDSSKATPTPVSSPIPETEKPAKTYTLEVEVLAETVEEEGPVRSNFVFDPNAYRSNKYRPPPGASSKSNKTKIEEEIESEVNLPRSQFKIGEIDVLGQISIEFSQDMIVQKDLDFSLVFEVAIESELSGERQFGTFAKSKSARRKMQVADNEDGPQLGLSWSLTNHTSRKIGLQLQYDNPYLVSQGDGKHDVLRIKAKNISLFQSEETGLAMRLEDQSKLADDDAFQSAIPKQTEDYESIYATKDQASSLQDQVDFLSKSNVVMVLLAQGSFQQFWGLLRTSQMLLFTSYINYNYPCVLQTFMAYTFYIAEMDVLNSGYILDHLEYQSGNREFNANFALFGVDSTQFVTNTGPVLAMAVVAILHYIFCRTLLSIARRYYKNKYCRKFAMYVDSVSLTLELVKLTNEAYIDFLLGAIMALSSIMQEQHNSFSHYFSTVPDAITNVLTLFFLVYCLGLPLFEFAMIRYGYRQGLIGKEPFSQRFDIFYEDFKKHDIYSLQFGVFMKVRRILVVGVLLGIHILPHIQSALLASLSLTNIMYLHTCKPYENPFDNRVELFNEAAVYFVSIFSMCFFASYPDSQMEEQFKNIVQYVVLYTIAGTLSINCLVMLVYMIKDIFNSLRSLVGSCFSSASDYLKDKRRQKIYEKYPEELKYLKERELEKENIEKCKAWKEERDWCLSNGIEVSELPEEIEFQEIIKVYGFRSQEKNLEKQIELVERIREDKFQSKKRGNVIRKTMREPRQAKEIQGKIKNKSFLHPVAALDVVSENSLESSSPSPRDEESDDSNSEKRPAVNDIGLIQPSNPRNISKDQETYEPPRAQVPNLENNKDKEMFHLNKNINADVLRCLNEMKSLDGHHDTNSTLETLQIVREMMMESDDDKPLVSIIDSEIEDIENERSTKHEGYSPFTKSLYAGRADVKHQIALQEQRSRLEFVLDSEEQEDEDQEAGDGSPQESLPSLVARILLGYDSGAAKDGSSQPQTEAGLKEIIQDYVKNDREEIKQNSKVFAILSCFLEIEAYQFSTKEGLLHQIVHMETNQYEDDDLVSWPLTNIKQLLRSQRQKNADPLVCIYFFIRLLHGQEKSNSLLTFQPLTQIIHSFPLVAKSVGSQPAADRANLMKTLVEKHLPSSMASFNFMQVIKRKKVYYKCMCTQEQFMVLSINELEYLKINQFYGRQKINKKSYCPKCRLNRPGHFQDTSIVFLPEILIFQSNSVLDVNLDLTEYMDEQDQIEPNEVLSHLEQKTIDKLGREIQDLESIIDGTKGQDDEISYLDKVVADFEEAISSETLEDKLQSRQDIVDQQERRQNMVSKTTYECFSVVTSLGFSFRSYVLRDKHWIKIEGLRTKDVGKDLKMALANNGDETIMYQFFRRTR